MKTSSHLAFAFAWLLSIVLAVSVNHRFAWPIGEADYQKAVIYNLHPVLAPYADEKGAHVHCTEELNGGGYRNGKYVYLKAL